MYPLRFVPLYQYRLWGGRELSELLEEPLPVTGPVGEAWLLSDRPDHPSRVADGPLRGRTLSELIDEFARPLFGRQATTFRRFPLLLKYLDVRDMLSVQVHPSDANAQLLPAGETGKTEAWIVLKASMESRVYAGLRPGTTLEEVREAVVAGDLTDRLASFVPRVGDCVLIPAGTVHSLGGDLVVFELQQNSDVTFRLYDWGHIDPLSGRPRPLQVEEALACLDFEAGPVRVVETRVDAATPDRETLLRCEAFRAWRVRSSQPIHVGEAGVARVIVCTDGVASLAYDGVAYPVRRGGVLLLPAEIGACLLYPTASVEVVEIALPETDARLGTRAGPGT